MAVCLVASVMRLTAAPGERVWVVVLRIIAFFRLHAHRESRVASWSCAARLSIRVTVKGLEVREPAHPGGKWSTAAMTVCLSVVRMIRFVGSLGITVRAQRSLGGGHGCRTGSKDIGSYVETCSMVCARKSLPVYP